MKRNAIARIIIYSVIILLLTGILVTALGLGAFMFRVDSGSGTTIEDEFSVDASGINKIDIDWAAGSVDIQVADTDQITIREVLPENSIHKMTYNISGTTLELDYGATLIGFGNWSTQKKDLIVTVPQDWLCRELEIDGAAVKVSVNGLVADDIQLDGAAMELDFVGTFRQLTCDGAGCSLNITAVTAPDHISLDGAGCELKVILPEDCGFTVYAEGLGIHVDSDVKTYYENGGYHYGNGHCRMDAEGMGCVVGIYYTDHDIYVSEAT